MGPLDFLAPIASAFGQAAQNQWAAGQAQKQMDFQERMSSTAHQREVADLRAAGLNPMLSVNAGESTPGGAMATGASPVGAGISTALDTQRLSLERAQTAANVALAADQAKAARAKAALDAASVPLRSAVGSVATDASGLYGKLKDFVRDLLSPQSSAKPSEAPSIDVFGPQPTSAKQQAVKKPATARVFQVDTDALPKRVPPTYREPPQ